MKFPKTRQGLARRKEHPEQFNPANGEPHTKKWLKEQREAGLRRKR